MKIAGRLEGAPSSRPEVVAEKVSGSEDPTEEPSDPPVPADSQRSGAPTMEQASDTPALGEPEQAQEASTGGSLWLVAGALAGLIVIGLIVMSHRKAKGSQEGKSPHEAANKPEASTYPPIEDGAYDPDYDPFAEPEPTEAPDPAPAREPEDRDDHPDYADDWDD
ncbi:hypothetical protein M3D92_04485 [Micrococcus terreus]|uniref:hypothetical protein n=1 Tax=Micrococcus terreus TaxID=574650 RepID=UPI0021A2B11F|nr:hypothetical protein [Micrococcus terreus]MCT2088558.1 hypothetical protein [Micrococcus terreus]